MGAALIFPIAVVVILAVVWFVFGARSTRTQARAEKTLPLDPYERREEELSRLRAEHEAADPERVQHPARRP